MRRDMPADKLSTMSSSTFSVLPNLHDAKTMSTNDSGAKRGIPVLLLKTKSTPNDGYEEQLSVAKQGESFDPIFVPVLEHQFLEEGLSVVRDLLRNKQIQRNASA